MQLCICVFNTGDALNTKTSLIQQVPYDETEDVLLAYICDIFDISQPVRRIQLEGARLPSYTTTNNKNVVITQYSNF